MSTQEEGNNKAHTLIFLWELQTRHKSSLKLIHRHSYSAKKREEIPIKKSKLISEM